MATHLRLRPITLPDTSNFIRIVPLATAKLLLFQMGVRFDSHHPPQTINLLANFRAVIAVLLLPQRWMPMNPAASETNGL